MTTTTDLDRLLTSEELCQYLAIPQATLYQWRYKGEGPPAIKLGRNLRFRRRDVEAWLAERADGGR